MFKITGKQQFGGVWNDGKCLVVFNHGVGVTDDANTAKLMRDMGYTVEGEAKEKNIEKMTAEELKSYAAEHGIDLGEASKKADILSVISAVGATSATE